VAVWPAPAPARSGRLNAPVTGSRRMAPAMKAAVHTRYGPPEVVSITEVAIPTIANDQVLVRVCATTVNRTDCGWRAGKPFVARLVTGLKRPRAAILGGEFAGVVEAVGGDVTSFEVGDRVFGYRGFGAHAQFLSMPANGRIATIPTNVAIEQAAAGTEGSQYALSFIHTAKIRAGQNVLVYGATGAIGSAAVQLLKSMGASVTAVCDTVNVELVRGLGADRVVDYTVEDFTADAQVYDAVFDAVGKSSFHRCRKLLKRRGIYISSDLGTHNEIPALVLVTPLLGGRRVKFPMQKVRGHQMVEYLRRLMESGEFRPVIDRTYPLDQIVEAYRYVETGRKVGNVIISVDPSN
jgi:NADPH:quinone reductase-like Zn-dependent oxidoreductase